MLLQVILGIICRHKIDEPRIKARVGSAFSDLKDPISFWVTLHPFAFSFRIWVFSFSLIFLQGYLVTQFNILMLSTVFVLSALGTRPFASPTLFFFHFYGEATLLGVIDCLITSSDPAVEPQGRILLGDLIMAQVMMLITVTQLYVILTQFRNLRRVCRNFLKKRQHRKI